MSKFLIVIVLLFGLYGCEDCACSTTQPTQKQTISYLDGSVVEFYQRGDADWSVYIVTKHPRADPVETKVYTAELANNIQALRPNQICRFYYNYDGIYKLIKVETFE